MNAAKTARATATTDVAVTAKAIASGNIAKKATEGIILAAVTLLASLLLSSCATPTSSVGPEQFVANDIMATSSDKALANEGAPDESANVTVTDNRAATFNAATETSARKVPTTTQTTTQVGQMAEAGCFKVDATTMDFDFTDTELNGLDEPGTTIVELADNTANVDGEGAAFNENTLEITAGGIYELEGTLESGTVVVNAPGEDVQLVLHDLTIATTEGPAIDVKAANQMVMTFDGNVILGDTQVTSASLDATETEGVRETIVSDSGDIDPTLAVITCDADLVINGTGTLHIASADEGGVYCAGTLALMSGNYDVVVAGNGFYAVDAIKVADGNYRVDAGEQAFTAINLDDFNLGYVAFEGGTYDVSADEFVETSSFLAITDGTYNLLCTEDAIASNIDMYIGGGEFGIITNGYGFNAETNLVTEGGDVTDFYGIDTYTADTLYATPTSLASDTTYDDPVDNIAEYGYYTD